MRRKEVIVSALCVNITATPARREITVEGGKERREWAPRKRK